MKSLRLLLRRVLAWLIVFGLLAGNAAYAMPDGVMQEGGRTGKMALAVCEQVSSMPSFGKAASAGEPSNNTMPPDCLMMKQIACAQVPALPSGAAGPSLTVTYAAVVYWSRADAISGITRKPDLFPPIID